MDTRENIIGIAKTYKEEVQKKFPLKIDQFYLFGSYAKGTQHWGSDIDVALVVDNYTGKRRHVIQPLWDMGGNIDSRIEPHLIARERDYAGFLDEIERTGIVI
jgi:predicted nucleotidyltransferase